MSGIRFAKESSPRHPARDSLELASLASSSEGAEARSSSSPSGISSSRKLSLENDDGGGGESAPGGSADRPGHDRTYSVSSAFDFASNLYPLTSTVLGGYAPVGAPSSTFATDDPLSGGSLEKHKSLSYLNGLSLLIGLIIGSGIFSSPGPVNANAGSPGAALIVWVVAGVLVWTGAASYAELGSAIPLNGGPQAYLSKIFGEFAGFLFTWCAVWVLKPGSAAIISIIFGEYVVRAVVGGEAVHINHWIDKGVAVGGLLTVLLVNCLSTKLATRTGDVFMFFKFVALLGVTVTGVVVAATGFSWKGPANEEWKKRGWFDNTSTDPSSWAVALYAGLWAFDGWDNVNYVVGEFHHPKRDLPRVIHTAMPVVILSYLLANVAYIFVLPFETIKKSNTVAVQFGSKVLGPVGSLLLALVVSASCFGALNATTFTSGRLVYAASKEGYLPSVLGRLGFGFGGGGGGGADRNPSAATRVHPRSRAGRCLGRLVGDRGRIGFTPVNALCLNALLTTVYIVIGDFSTLITFYGVAGYAFYFLTVLGLIVLRVKEPTLERPYQTWISTPIIFCCVSLFLLSRALFAQPRQTAVVLAFMCTGLPAYGWYRRSRRRAAGHRSKRAGAGDAAAGWRFWRRWRRPR
ncbi:MAG: hypothetical protein M1826_002714 [Phylliscum demangeonii]|nr:MAG: hypothetical protein M1826_002714 [Phylliscum demangeonii]